MKKLLLTLLLLPYLAYAGNKPGAVSLTLGEGYDYFASKRNLKNASVPFLDVGYNFNQRWGIEGFLGQFNTKFRSSQHDNRQVNGTLFAVDAIYRFPIYKTLEPYALAGVGILGLNPNGNDANNEGNINAGLGLELFLTKPLAFRIDARDFYTIVGGKNDIFLDAGLTVLLGCV